VRIIIAVGRGVPHDGHAEPVAHEFDVTLDRTIGDFTFTGERRRRDEVFVAEAFVNPNDAVERRATKCGRETTPRDGRG